MNTGLSEKTLAQLRMVFANYPAVDQAVLYGSRAKGTFHRGSDIDLVLRGSGLNFTTVRQIEDALDDLLLPYLIDISVFDQISNPELIEHIERAGFPLYDKEHALN